MPMSDESKRILGVIKRHVESVVDDLSYAEQADVYNALQSWADDQGTDAEGMAEDEEDDDEDVDLDDDDIACDEDEDEDDDLDASENEGELNDEIPEPVKFRVKCHYTEPDSPHEITEVFVLTPGVDCIDANDAAGIQKRIVDIYVKWNWSLREHEKPRTLVKHYVTA